MWGSVEKKIEQPYELYRLWGKQTDNDGFLEWLCPQSGISDVSRLQTSLCRRYRKYLMFHKERQATISSKPSYKNTIKCIKD
jgi:hypothetical protein